MKGLLCVTLYRVYSVQCIVYSELGLMKGLLCVTGPIEIVGGASHCQSLQVTEPPETVGRSTANLCRLQCLQR
jgi:hypothetical protein